MRTAVLWIALTPCIFADEPAPKPITAWAAGPLETRVAFDRDVPKSLADALIDTRIVSGDDVKAGDRYESRKPGDPPPAGVERGSLRIAAARVEGRLLVLATDPHSRDTTYALNLPAPINSGLTYRLRGVEYVLTDAMNRRIDAGVWRVLDSAQLPREMDRLAWMGKLTRGAKATRLVLRTLAALPKGKVTVTARASAPFTLDLGAESAKSSGKESDNTAVVTTEVETDVTDLTWTLELSGPLSFSATYRAGDGPERPLTAEQLILPWAPPPAPNVAPLPVPEGVLKGGNPAKGGLIFKSEGAKCATCHKVRGEGGEVGPDLSDLVHRDRAWVYRQINEPTAMIHPDYVPYTVLTKDGGISAGIVRAEGADAIKITTTEAKSTVVAKANIEELKPSATSIMPVGLLGAVGEEGVRDLVAFLTTPPPAKR